MFNTRKAKIITAVFALAAAVCCCAASTAAYLILFPSEPEFAVAGPKGVCEQDLVEYLRGTDALRFEDFAEGGAAFEWLKANFDEFAAEVEAEIGTSYKYTGMCFLGEYVVFSYDLPRSAVQVIAKVQSDGSLKIVYYYYPFGNPGLGLS